MSEDWAFGTVEKRKASKTKHLIRGHRCNYCAFKHEVRKPIDPDWPWCRKKTDQPEGNVCEWYQPEPPF